MAVIAYPLNNVTYSAEDAQTYFSFRSSGVNSYYDDFIVSPKEGMVVTVSTGLGWMKPGDFMGFSVASTKPVDITLEASHATMSRYDRIVARYTADGGGVEIVVKTGTPATDPKPPAVERSASVYELGFCTIRVGPNVTAITNSDITDTRPDSAICGITGDSQASGKSKLTIAFPDVLVDQPYTVSTPSGVVHSGYVPVSCIDYVFADQQNTTYTVNASVGEDKYAGSVELGPYYGAFTIAVAKEYAGPSRVLSENDWATIRDAAASGQASNYWGVGDTKPVRIKGTLDSYSFNLTLDAFIVGFNHNSDKEGNNKIHFQLGKKSGKLTALVYNTYGVSEGFCMDDDPTSYFEQSWEWCGLRQEMLGGMKNPLTPDKGTLAALLPAELRAVMVSVQKYTDNRGGGTEASGNVSTTTDYIWLMSEYEVWGKTIYGDKYEAQYQKQYDYYKSNPVIAYDSMYGSATEYFLRSRFPGSPTGYGAFTTIDERGEGGTAISNSPKGILPCFAVGGQ